MFTLEDAFFLYYNDKRIIMRCIAMIKKNIEFILVRHAQSMQNIGRALSGFHADDAPLTEEGMRQAAALANRFSEGSLTSIYSSTLIRTCQTVQPTAEKLLLPVNVLPELMEVGTVICGTDLSNIRSLAPAAYESARMLFGNIISYTLENETTSHCVSRAEYVLQMLMERHNEGDRILIATHGAFFGYLLRCLLGLELPEPFSWQVNNCAVTDILIRPDRNPLLICSNDQSHLYIS